MAARAHPPSNPSTPADSALDFEINRLIGHYPRHGLIELVKEQVILLRELRTKYHNLLRQNEKNACPSTISCSSNRKRHISSSDVQFSGEEDNIEVKKIKTTESTKSRHQRIRKQNHIMTEGEDVPPPVKKFRKMNLPKVIIHALKKRDMQKPTPIQIQGLPAVLSGRDVIAVAPTGSGKTMLFVLPVVTYCLEQIHRRYKWDGEPYALIINPTRELAAQTNNIVQSFFDVFTSKGKTKLRSCLLSGGLDPQQQRENIYEGIHVAVGTLGKLKRVIEKKMINLFSCRFLCLDHAENLTEESVREDLKTILLHLKTQSQEYQTIMLSATMPKVVLELAKDMMVRPLTITNSRPGAASLHVRQVVTYVEPENKKVNILEALKETLSPILIFVDKKSDVEYISEFLRSQNLSVVSLHSCMTQKDRESSVQKFTSGMKEILVATDVASRGLDFLNLNHVINVDMPKDIDTYVQRIGRTGRHGEKGVSTAFVNEFCGKALLTDLKKLLIEANQDVPPFLAAVETEMEQYLSVRGEAGCSYCSGLGHTINCPKLEASQNIGRKDYLAPRLGDW